MTADRWAEVKRIFQAALDLSPADRSAFLSAESPDLDIRREVESLLAAEDASSDFLDTPAADYVPGALDDLDDNLGRVIGPWRLIREIGTGGMGSVYLAERQSEFHQKAALKLMRRGMDSRSIISRFRYERQILAGLDHPNIAKLLDGGATDDGRPYFVMEHVEGVPLDQWVTARVPSTGARLALFLQICGAVQYAHQNLIVHRDLKPGNILVTSDGTPKLLDFGIAKLLRAEPVEQTAGLTQPGVRLMTPEYASPEQVRGLPATTTTDIYSLGVILYELLTGRPPYSFPTRSPLEVERIITTQDPPRPSLHTRGLDRDLDVITLKALEKDPARRYASVEQVAGDIRRHLDGVPIVARPHTLAYSVGRFVRRNRVPVVAATVVLVTLTVSLAVSLRERARAERNFNDLRRLTQSFLFDFHDHIKDLPGSTDARNAVLQTALEYLRRLGTEERANSAVARDVAEAWLRLGDVQGNPYGANRGNTAAALASYREALSLSEELIRRDPTDTRARLYLARAHRATGELLPQHGSASEALTHLRAAVEAAERTSDREELAHAYESLGDLLGHSGIANLNDPTGARAAYTKSLVLHQALQRRRGIGVIRMKLGDLALDADDSAAAIREYQAAASVFDNPREIAMIHRKIGMAYEAMGKPEDAEREYAETTRISRDRMLADPKNSQARMDYAVILKYRADLRYKNRRYAAALPLYRETLDLLTAQSAAVPANVVMQSRRAEMLISVGATLHKLDQSAEGQRLYSQGLTILRSIADRSDATPADRSSYAQSVRDNPFSGK